MPELLLNEFEFIFVNRILILNRNNICFFGNVIGYHEIEFEQVRNDIHYSVSGRNRRGS